MALAELVVSLGLDANLFASGLTSAQAEAFNASRGISNSFGEASRSIDGLGMAADNVKFDKLSSNLNKELSKAAGEIYSFGATVSEEINSTVKGIGIGLAIGIVSASAAAVYGAYKIISGTFSFIAGLLNGESYQSDNIDSLIEANKAVLSIKESLGLSVLEAQALGDAVSRLGITSDVESTFNSAQTAMRRNRDELERLSVAYKDSNGNLLENSKFLENVKRKLDEYKEGTDRAMAATAIGAGSYKQVTDALQVTDAQLEISAARLGDYQLLISEDTQTAVDKYSKAMAEFENETKLTSRGFSNAIATSIMPALTDLAIFFKDGFPFVVRAFRGSLATITALLYGLKTSFNVVYESIAGSVSALGSVIAGLGAAVVAVFSGEGFGKAGEAISKGLENAKGKLGKTGDDIVAQARKNRDAIALAYGLDSLETQSIAGARANNRRGGKEFEPPPPKAGGGASSKAVSDYERLNKQIQEAIGLENQQLELKRDLTKEELFLRKIRADAADSKIPLTAQQNKTLEENLSAFKAISDRVNAQERSIKTQNEYAELIAKNYEQEQKDIEAVSQARQKAEQQGIKSSQTQIKNLEFENSLMLLNSDQRQIAIALRDLENSGINKQDEAYQNARVSIQGLITEGQRLTEVNKFFADLESASRTTFENILTNAKNPFGALKNLIKKELINALFELTAKKWIIDIQASIGGGSSGGGGGGIISKILDAGLKFFGRANGGTTSPGGIYEVNERGTPEMFSVGGRDFLMSGNKAGMVTNGARAAQAPRSSGGVTINQSFDNRGADPGSAARLQAVAERIKAETIAAVQAKANRGGSFARSLGRA
ncbi:hypothetical protein [Undibacterium sp.]|uniref:hypothetical protein n=1 Tax=Undibacterium sp. TaxID=1914977 RepID=UPI0037505266